MNTLARARLGILIGMFAALCMSATAHADSMFDVEHARAIARAGGPVSPYDAELLERHGTYSGTPSDWRERRSESWTWYAEPRRRAYRKLDARRYRESRGRYE